MTDDADDEAPESSPADVKRVIARIMREGSDGIMFDKREAVALQEMARLYLGLKVIGRFANGIKNFGLAVGWFVGLYLAYKMKILPQFLSGGEK